MSTRKTFLLASFLLAILIVGGSIVSPSTFDLGRPTEVNGATALPQSGLARFFNDPLSIFSRLHDADNSQDAFANRAKNQIAIPTKSISELSPTIQEIRKRIIASQIENRGGDILLAESDKWTIEYIPTPDYFHVTVLQDPADTAKKEVERWFLAFDLQQNDLCDLPVRFILNTEELRRNNINFTSLPNGCE